MSDRCRITKHRSRLSASGLDIPSRIWYKNTFVPQNRNYAEFKINITRGENKKKKYR